MTALLNPFRFGAASAPVTSYANPGGSGNRVLDGTVTVTTTATLGASSTTVNQMLDGTQVNEVWWTAGQSGRELKFDFVTPKCITEVKWYQDNSSTHGTWKWQGSPDGTSWTDIGSAFTLGNTLQTITELSVNTATYRYYRMLQTAGTTSSSPFLREIEFKISA